MNQDRRRALADDYAWVVRRYRRAVRRVPEAWARGAGAPVLLIAGVYEPWSFMVDLGDRINRAGHPVHVVPAIGRNSGAISSGAEQAAHYLAEHDLRQVLIVGHSKGGLVGKRLMMADADGRVDRMIAIATPFGGSDRAKYLPMRAFRDLRPAAAEISALVASREVNARITSIFTTWDAHIPNGSRLEGARNIELPMLGHFRLLSDERLLSTVERELGMD